MVGLAQLTIAFSSYSHIQVISKIQVPKMLGQPILSTKLFM